MTTNIYGFKVFPELLQEKCRIKFLQGGVLHYETDSGFVFEVPVEGKNIYYGTERAERFLVQLSAAYVEANAKACAARRTDREVAAT